MAEESKAAKPKNIFLEACRCFWRDKRAWVRQALWFFILASALGFVLFSHIGCFVEADRNYYKIEDEAHQAVNAEARKLLESAGSLSVQALRLQTETVMLKKNEMLQILKRSPEYAKFRAASIWLSMLYFGIFIIFFSSLYFFNLYFLKTDPPSKGMATLPSWSGVGYFVWKSILRYFIVCLPLAFLSGLAGGFGKAAFPRMLSSPVAIVLFVIAGAALYISVVIFIKFWLVSVLASDEIDSPFEASSTLTKGKLWRLFGSLLIFSISALIAFMILLNGGLLAAVLLRSLLQEKSWLHALLPTVGIMIFAGALTSFYGFYSALQCTAYRILFQEHQKDNPSFTLAQRA